METGAHGGKMSCTLCSKTIDVRSDSGTLVTKHGTMCVACGTEYREERTRLEAEAKRWITRKMRLWVQQQKTVKRFYTRQRRLPLDGGEE